MQFSGEGYIINLRRHGENSLIVTLLSSEYGKVSGYAKGALSKKKLGIFQLGNAISFNAYARIEENLPQFRGIELLQAHSVSFMADEKKLAVLRSFCELMNVCLAEKEPLEHLSPCIDSFMKALETAQWLTEYSFLEYNLLEFLGVGLDLSECAATGTISNLEYVSPKSGKAVCFEAGQPYAAKLFKYPHDIVQKNKNPTNAEIADLLEMTGFFLNKNFFQIHGLKFPNNRDNLLNILNLKKELG